MLRDMITPEGEFASAEDADSDVEEGKFYAWSYEELFSLLGAEELAELEKRFAVQAKGNYQEEATGKQTKKNTLFMHQSDQTQGDGEKPGLVRFYTEEAV